MLTARPIQAFRLGGKSVLICRVLDENPHNFLGKEFGFYSEGREVARIRIEGVSTASNAERGVFDFSYSGDEIRSEQVNASSLITDGLYEEAKRELSVV